MALKFFIIKIKQFLVVPISAVAISNNHKCQLGILLTFLLETFYIEQGDTESQL
jgi:hypothetical protein